MTKKVTIDLDLDPELVEDIEKMKEWAPRASTSDLIRAALRCFVENVSDFDFQAYLEQQFEFDKAGEE